MFYQIILLLPVIIWIPFTVLVLGWTGDTWQYWVFVFILSPIIGFFIAVYSKNIINFIRELGKKKIKIFSEKYRITAYKYKVPIWKRIFK